MKTELKAHEFIRIECEVRNVKKKSERNDSVSYISIEVELTDCWGLTL